MLKDKANGKITVANIALAQLSRGLYRTTAAVFKELINNAYDADATEVRVNTNYPEFDYIACVDNGKGMPLEDFVEHFSAKGIGSSTKRRDNANNAGGYTEIYQRPVIGRLGIGLTAMGQLCHSFEMESHYIDKQGNKQAYRMEIVLTDDTIPDIETIIRQPDFTGKTIDVGEWCYEIIEYNESRKGMRIYSADVRGTFRREMQQSFGKRNNCKRIPFSLKSLADMIYKKPSIRASKPYIETIWELSILCPLPYYDNEYSPVNVLENGESDVENSDLISFLKGRNRILTDYNFRIYFDGIELKRLIKLPLHPYIKPKIYFIDFDGEVFESRLKFSGYIYASGYIHGKRTRPVKPEELNGIQLRLRNVGIGGYDNTFLSDYRHVEGSRNKQITGEIFVDEGLESALNIDRDSFNEHEEQYKFMQNHIHNFLDRLFEDLEKIAIANEKAGN